MPSDVYAIIDLVATILTHKNLSCYSEHPSAIKGMFQQSIYRSLGLSAHLGWAWLLIDRINKQINYPDARFNSGIPVTTETTRRTSTRSTSTPTLALLEQAAAQCP